MARAYLALGANVGNRRANLRAGLAALGRACRVVAVSSLYRSPAVVPGGAPPGPDYLNAACAVDTALSPDELLALAKRIEHAIGRRPAPRWAPRPIDIDLLLYDDVIVDTPQLTVPHPRIAARAFVLLPLAELAPDARQPALAETVGALAAAVDAAGTERVEGPGWAAGAV